MSCGDITAHDEHQVMIMNKDDSNDAGHLKSSALDSKGFNNVG